MKKDVCILTAYFGVYPKYFSLWLKSCEKNPKIDFLVFSDASYEHSIPENVKIIKMSLLEMKRLAEKKMEMKISLEFPYKCCDFKPLYGKIFQDYISEYEYWGHCDIDLIFGDIWSFLQKYNYKLYDKFLPLGHLCLYRNTETVNDYYMLSGSDNGDYTEVFTTDESFAFDEIGGIVQIYLKNKLPMFSDRLFADISHWYKRFRLSEYCHLGKQDVNYDYQVFFWENGKTYRAYIDKGKLQTEEYMYVHFKKRPDFDVSFDPSEIEAFYITYDGFVPKKDMVITKEVIQKYNHFSGKLWEEIELLLWKISDKKEKAIKKLRIK